MACSTEVLPDPMQPSMETRGQCPDRHPNSFLSSSKGGPFFRAEGRKVRSWLGSSSGSSSNSRSSSLSPKRSSKLGVSLNSNH